MRGKFIIINGPVAGGKSTVKAMIKEMLNGRAWAITQSPFALITYALTRTITALTMGRQCGSIYPLTCLEIRRPQLLGKLLNVFIMLDLAQSIAIAVITRLLNMVGINVVVEDYLPTIILDHTLYKKLYARSTTNNKIINTLYNSSLATLQALRPMGGIYVHADTDVRVKRSIMRGYRVARPDILHDNVRNHALITAMKLTINEIHIINNNGSLTETRKQITNALKLNEQ